MTESSKDTFYETSVDYLLGLTEEIKPYRRKQQVFLILSKKYLLLFMEISQICKGFVAMMRERGYAKKRIAS